MTHEPSQTDPPDFDDAAASEDFARDLRAVTERPVEIPGAIDETILAASRSQLAGPSPAPATPRTFRLRRWGTLTAAAAAIAIIAWVGTKSGSSRPAASPDGSTEPGLADAAIIRGDIDGSGRLDILDAYALARRLETDGQLDAAFDFNADGGVDQQDVEAIARRVVTLSGGRES